MQKWTNKEEAKDNYYTQTEKERQEKLKAELKGTSLSLLESYAVAIENKTDCLHYNLGVKILNLGTKIGTELGKCV